MISIAFYKAEEGLWYDKLIAWYTRPSFWNFFKTGKYSHVEILFDGNECFSSSGRDGGTRWKLIDNIRTSGKWDIMPIAGDTAREKVLISQLERQLNKKYDWYTIIFYFIMHISEQDPHRWTCSELVSKFVFNFRSAYKYSPNNLADVLINNFKYKLEEG